jgi:peptidyl-prolyl cis-trans isomerase C
MMARSIASIWRKLAPLAVAVVTAWGCGGGAKSAQGEETEPIERPVVSTASCPWLASVEDEDERALAFAWATGPIAEFDETHRVPASVYNAEVLRITRWNKSLRTAPAEEQNDRALQIADRVMRDCLANRLALEAGIEVDDAEVDRVYVERAARYDTEAAFEEALAEQGHDRASIRHAIRLQIGIEELLDKRGYPDVTDEDVTVYYRNHPDEFAGAPRVAVRSIAVPIGDPEDPELVAQKKVVAEEIARRAGEESFDDAVEYAGGLDGVEVEGRVESSREGMHPRLGRAAFEELRPGDASSVLRTPEAFHVVELVERLEPKPRPLEEVRQEVRTRLEQSMYEKQRSELLDGVVDKRNISIEGENIETNQREPEPAR